MDILLVQAIFYKRDLNVPMTFVPGAGASLVVVQHGDQPLLGSGKIKLMVSVVHFDCAFFNGVHVDFAFLH